MSKLETIRVSRRSFLNGLGILVSGIVVGGCRQSVDCTKHAEDNRCGGSGAVAAGVGGKGEVRPTVVVPTVEVVPTGSVSNGENQMPQVCPLSGDVVMTQGYGVGSHAPAETWGGIDLAIDGNGDGYADPDATHQTPVYAANDGVARVTPNSWPGGNYLQIGNDTFRSEYGHLDAFTVNNGDDIKKGDLVGLVGTTGQSSGPHLHLAYWELVNGSWVNVDPLGGESDRFGIRRLCGI